MTIERTTINPLNFTAWTPDQGDFTHQHQREIVAGLAEEVAVAQRKADEAKRVYAEAVAYHTAVLAEHKHQKAVYDEVEAAKELAVAQRNKERLANNARLANNPNRPNALADAIVLELENRLG